MLEGSKTFDTIIIFPVYLFFFRRNYDYAKLLSLLFFFDIISMKLLEKKLGMSPIGGLPKGSAPLGARKN